jgi:hypothetical protein
MRRMTIPDEPFHLSRMASPRRRRALLIVGVVTAALLIGGVVAAVALTRESTATPAAQQQAQGAPAPTTAAAGTASSPPVALSTSPATKSVDEAAVEACGLADKATGAQQAGDGAYDPKQARAIGIRAGESAVPSVRIQGTRIVELADRAAKTGDAYHRIEMGTAVISLSTYCLNNGLTVR